MSPLTVNLSDLSHQCVAVGQKVARAAGSYLQGHFGPRIATETKSGYFDVVTPHDRYAEQQIVEGLLQDFPEAEIVREEGQTITGGDLTWFIDPIDGTSNFASGFPFYCVSLGAAWRGRLIAGVIYDPQRDELFHADLERSFLNGTPISVNDTVAEHEALCITSWPYEGRSSGIAEDVIMRQMCDSFRAVRRLGSAALGLAWVAAGRADATSELLAKTWDVAAGFHIVRQAGGVVALGPQDPDCQPWYAARYIAHVPGLVLSESSMRGVVVP